MNNVRQESRPIVRRELEPASLYRAVRAVGPVDFAAALGDFPWKSAHTAAIDHFHPSSSSHRPKASARVVFDQASIHVRFDVQDQFVRSTHLTHQSLVSQDSCVEFFVQPAGSVGYFNFEVNAGGTMLVYFIEDPTRGENGILFKRFTVLPIELIEPIAIHHTLPRVVEPERTEPTPWTVGFSIPFALLDRYAPGASEKLDRPWRCNFHKCGDKTSHPHWGSWADIGETLRFHQPDKFGQLIFDLR